MPETDWLAVIRWWLVLMLMGAIALPLTFTILGRLADRGYAFTKMIGLLLVSYFFWLGGSLGFLTNNMANMGLVLVGVCALSIGVYVRGQRGLGVWLQQNKGQILVTELLFVIIFVGWAWVRAQNPAITATEKPMEFAFLNGIARSESFPPLDPWLSGYGISYYYFGYIMVSVLGRLAGVTEAVGFNLAIAWLVAGTAIGSYGLVYNLVRSEMGQKLAVGLGLVAALAIPLAGNMQILLETLHGNNIGSPEFWAYLDIIDINGASTDTPRYEGTGWWWWRSSRVINEYHLSGQDESGLDPIAEFPGFSFVLGDLHPHVLALPFALLSLGVALAWWQEMTTEEKWVGSASSWFSIAPISGQLFSLTVLVLGGLSFLNTWDVLIHLFVVVGVYLLGVCRHSGKWGMLEFMATGRIAVMLVVPAFLLYLPFYIGFSSQAGAPFLLPFLMRPTRLVQFLVIFIMPLSVILLLLVAVTLKTKAKEWRTGLVGFLVTIIGLYLLMAFFSWLVAISPNATPVQTLASQLGVNLPSLPIDQIDPGQQTFARIRWGTLALVRLLPAVLVARAAYAGLTLLLAGVIAVLFMLLRGIVFVPASPNSKQTPSHLPFVLLLVLTGSLLTIGPEFVYLKDNFGQRLNTIFKFYYQAWAMFGIAGIYGLAYLQKHHLKLGRIAGIGYTLLFLIALTFPYHAIQSRQEEYAQGQNNTPTLNGLAYLMHSNPDEYAALSWLRENVSDTPIILEAVGGQYSNYGRVSATTGLPTLLGWAGHEYQWRGYDHPEPAIREPLVRQIYSTPNLENVVDLLNQHKVTYIYVGGLERSSYGPNGLEKFAGNLEIAFQNQTVTIYRWRPQ